MDGFRGPGLKWAVMLDCRAHLTSLYATWVVIGVWGVAVGNLGGFRGCGGCWVVILDSREYLASVWAIWLVLRGLAVGGS